MTEPTPSSLHTYWENEYNPRVRVHDPQRYFDAWAKRAELTRARLPGVFDLAYGSHVRERLDLFRPASSRGTLVFIHGGYWRTFEKESYSWIAEPFVRAGITVAIPSYPLAPAVRLADIVRSVCLVVPYLEREVLNSQERQKLVIVGHSAGAHLAACLLASGREAGSVAAIVCISGLFDLLPVMYTQMLGNMGWTPAELHAVSPLYMAQPSHGTVLLAVGGDESREFHMQSTRLAHTWSDRVAGVFAPVGRNHFSVIDDLFHPDYELTRVVTDLFA